MCRSAATPSAATGRCGLQDRRSTASRCCCGKRRAHRVHAPAWLRTTDRSGRLTGKAPKYLGAMMSVPFRNNEQYYSFVNISKRICILYRYTIISPPQREGPMDFELSATSEALRKRLQSFFDQQVLPRHRGWLEHTAQASDAPPFMAELQQKARDAGLWNLGLPELADDEPGTRLSNLEYAPLAEIMGRLFWASEVFNCQAPDVPNMIALHNCATSEQKARWLRPLLEAETRSAFGMTERVSASSSGRSQRA